MTDMSSNCIIKCHQMIANTSPFRFLGKSLDFEIKKGRIIVLTGVDTISKNDWLKTLGGVYYPVNGSIDFFGKNTIKYNTAERAELRKKIAYVSEELNLLSVLNGLTNVMLPALYHKLGDAEQIKAKAMKLISQLGVSNDLELLPADMHKDQHYFLIIARALMLDPVVLCLEKPFFLLDAVSAKQFKQFLLHKAKQENMTIIVSTQDFHFISQFADDILFINQEKLLSFDNRDDFLNCDDSMVSTFIKKANNL